MSVAAGVQPQRVVVVFLDGVGIGPDDPERNPLAAAKLANLERLLDGGRPVSEAVGPAGIFGANACLVGLDAALDVEGRPQSGTGQTALLTGRNAAKLLGRHFGPWVPTALRELLKAENLFHRARSAGHRVAFANAYPSGHLEPGGRGVRRPGAIPFAAHAAGVLERDEASLRAAGALVSSITTDAWRRYVDPLAPLVAPEDAGRTLAAIADDHDLTLFAHYDTDYAGHRGDLREGVTVMERVDAFLGGLLPQLAPDMLLLVTSDHGNLEDATTGHTRNPVPLLAVGAGSADVARGARSILDVAPLILSVLETRVDQPQWEGSA